MKMSWKGLSVRERDIERSVRAVEAVGEILVALRLLEIGQHVGEGPAACALRGPMIVIGGVTARINHGVDSRRPAERLAARLVAAPPVEALLRHRFECPVVEVRRHHQGAGEGRVDDPAVARSTGFEQADGEGCILTQPASERATGRAATQY